MKMKNATGFPSPAQGYEKNILDYNTLLIKNPAATFTMRISGENLADWGILSGDFLVVDSSVRAKRNRLVVSEIDGEFRCVPFDENVRNVFGTVTAVVRLI